MRTRLSVILLIAAVAFALPSVVGAQSRAEPSSETPLSTAPTWTGYYYNNSNLSGNPVMVREDADINFKLGHSSPAPGIVPATNWSARWERYVETPAGRYRVDITSDDGARVWVNGKLIVDAWQTQPATPRRGEVEVGAGTHLVIVEYFQASGDATLFVDAAPVAAPSAGWKGEYFTNMQLSGRAAMVRDDPTIDFNWGYGSPATGIIPTDGFSVRWTKTLALSPGQYRFATTTDDGVRLYVNGNLLINKWYTQNATSHADVIYVPGPAEVVMEYFEDTGTASARLQWDYVGGGTGGVPPGSCQYHTVKKSETLYSLAQHYGTSVSAIQQANGLTSEAIYAGQRLCIPVGGDPAGTVIVDELSPQFMEGGSPTGWQRSTAGYAGGSYWVLNNDVEHANYNWARWIPALPAGTYEVFAHIPSLNAFTTSAKYWVAHSGGFASRTINQTPYSDEWVSLGTYKFVGNGAEYVSLNDITGEPRLSVRIGYDAVKWVPR